MIIKVFQKVVFINNSFTGNNKNIIYSSICVLPVQNYTFIIQISTQKKSIFFVVFLPSQNYCVVKSVNKNLKQGSFLTEFVNIIEFNIQWLLVETHNIVNYDTKRKSNMNISERKGVILLILFKFQNQATHLHDSPCIVKRIILMFKVWTNCYWQVTTAKAKPKTTISRLITKQSLF